MYFLELISIYFYEKNYFIERKRFRILDLCLIFWENWRVVVFKCEIYKEIMRIVSKCVYVVYILSLIKKKEKKKEVMKKGNVDFL